MASHAAATIPACAGAASQRPRAVLPAPRRRRAPLHSTFATKDRGGGAVLDRPSFGTIGPDGTPLTDSAGSKLDSNGGRGLGGGSWRVLLLDSDKHVEARVVDAIMAVVGADQAHAQNVFHTVRTCLASAAPAACCCARA